MYGVTEAKKDDSSSPPRPYGWWFHPYKTWVDVIVSWLLSCMMNLVAVAQGPALEDNDVTTAANAKMRAQMHDYAHLGAKPTLVKWAKGLGVDDMVEVTVAIPRRADLWQSWKINVNDAKTKELMAQNLRLEGDILVTLRMPMSVCSTNDQAVASTTDLNKFGCRTLETIEWAGLDAKAPLVMHFHGGGMTIGSRHDGDGLGVACEASLAAKKPLIFASVEYSLAPTHLFPSAPADALTVMDYFLEKMPGRALHLAGLSAGGNLALVCGMELHRRDPTKLGSLSAWSPLVDPASASLSYYMNRSSSLAPSAWIRWCWRCYLALPAPGDEHVDILSLKTLDERLKHGSNETAWEKSPWRHTPLARLVDPTLDLPAGLESESAPPMTVVTNQGDPLHDDGVKLVEALCAKGVKVTHLDHNGSHWLGTYLDSKNYQALVEDWKEMLFG